MIHVNKNYQDIPDQLKGEGAGKKREETLREGDLHEASGYYYAHDSVKEYLKKIYQNKCGYCEIKESSGFSWRVDHYRPRKSPKGELHHRGYYWLTYEWSNLILSCEKCNGAKSNHFPIQGKRIEHPQENSQDWASNSPSFLAEKPSILNPEIDQPGEHLDFLSDGSVQAKNDSYCGEVTIEICKLNREKLKLDRKDMVDLFGDFFDEQLSLFVEELKKGKLKEKKNYNMAFKLAFKNLIEEFFSLQDSSHQFSRLGWHMIQEFDIFILQKFPPGEPQEILKTAFEQFGRKNI